MTVNRDTAGNRYVEAEVEVPGSPEEVWRAIATGPGISSWFVPTAVEERVGGVTTSHFGPGMDSHATITTWEPPHRFVAESPDDISPGGPPVATEWSVETRSGDTCVVRVVHRWFTESDEWAEQFIGHTFGWLAFFRILKLYLTHFRDERGRATMPLVVTAPEPKEAAWAALTGPLGLANAAVGERMKTVGAPPPLGGVVAWAGQPEFAEELVLRLDEPTPGIAHLFAMPMGGQVFLIVRCYLYGPDAAAMVALLQPEWQAWLGEHFPMPAVAAAD